MNRRFFSPPRNRGLILHGVLVLVLVGLVMWGATNAWISEVGPAFIAYIFVALVGLLPLPLLAYRFYALTRSGYFFDRDNLQIQWGLRMEELPLSDVEWLRPATDLTTPLALPWFRLPGGVLGVRRHPDLGPVEFLASESDGLLLIATARRVYAISPEDSATFVREFQRSIEMGSLTPVPARSLYPSFVVLQAWENPVARFLWLAALLINIGLLAWVGTLIPTLHRAVLGFFPNGLPMDTVRPVQLMLLPVLSTALSTIGWLAGLGFYRREADRTLAFLLWISSALASLLFILGTLFLVNASF